MTREAKLEQAITNLFDNNRPPVFWIGETFSVDPANCISEHNSRSTIVIITNGVSVNAMGVNARLQLLHGGVHESGRQLCGRITRENAITVQFEAPATVVADHGCTIDESNIVESEKQRFVVVRDQYARVTQRVYVRQCVVKYETLS